MRVNQILMLFSTFLFPICTKFCTRDFHKILWGVCEFHINQSTVNRALLTDNEFILPLTTFSFLAALNSFRICELRDNKCRESRNFLAKMSETVE
jgi:hypothetical protein